MSSSRRSLFPREHGAYAELALPLAAAYAAGRPRLAAVLFGLAAVVLFLAHESLLVVCGHRGTRARKEAGARARRYLVASIGGSVAAGGVGALLAPGAAVGALVPLALAAVFGVFILKRRARTMVAEILAAAALSGAAIPVALASGWSATAAVAAFVGWAAGFAAITSVVWSLAHRQPTGPVASALTVVIPLLVTTIGGALFGRQAVVTSASLILATTTIVLLRPGARALRRIGWCVAAASTVSAVALIVVTIR